jgi:hypothetical protein
MINGVLHYRDEAGAWKAYTVEQLSALIQYLADVEYQRNALGMPAARVEHDSPWPIPDGRIPTINE